jgi:pilus assembly protein CpaF
MSWGAVQNALTPEQVTAVVEGAAKELSSLSLAVLRNRAEVGRRADGAVRGALRSQGGPQPDNSQIQAMINRVVARVGGLGFLDALFPPHCTEYTDVLVNADGAVWARRKSAMAFARLEHLAPTKEEVWRAVEALLAPEGRACAEATPSVDTKLPRDRELGFGGARVKVLHPGIAPGDGYPSLAIRLFEPIPVTPAQVVAWGVFTPPVMAALLDAVGRRLRVMVIGGTGTGKTTLLSALCHGIPPDARVVKVEDPEEIWLPHPNVVTLEARPAPPGSTVPAYTVTNGVDDALRLAPSHLIVGEVRKGDAALSLFRAMMSDHAGLTTFHADGPEHAAYRIGIIMNSDANVRAEAAKGMFAEAIDLVVQVGWRAGRRVALGVWEVGGLASNNDVKLRSLWLPGESEFKAPSRRRE